MPPALLTETVFDFSDELTVMVTEDEGSPRSFENVTDVSPLTVTPGGTGVSCRNVGAIHEPENSRMEPPVTHAPQVAPLFWFME